MKKGHSRLIRILIGFLIVLVVVYICFSCLRIGTAIIGIDYATFYTTGRMIQAGNIDQIYYMESHHAALESLFGEIPYLLEWI